MEIKKSGQNNVQESAIDTKQESPSDAKVISDKQTFGFASQDVIETSTPSDPFGANDPGVASGQNDEIPDDNETITGGHKSAEAPKSELGKPTDPTTPEQPLPTGGTWADAKAKRPDDPHEIYLLSGAPDTRKDTSTTEAGKPAGGGGQPETVGLDYFNKTKQVMDEIIANGDDVKKLKPEGGGTAFNPFPGAAPSVQTVGRGFGRNKVSGKDEISEGETKTTKNKDGSTTQTDSKGNSATTWRDSKGRVTKDVFVNKDNGESLTLRYNKSGNKTSVIFRDSEGSETTKWLGKDGNVRKTLEIDPYGKKIITKFPKSTPTPDSTDDESHLPKNLQNKEKTPTHRPGTEPGTQVTLTDDNKRQQEKVNVLRREIFGSVVARHMDGRSTPVDSDGTTDPGGPSTDGGIDVDLEATHRKGDPGDGDPDE